MNIYLDIDKAEEEKFLKNLEKLGIDMSQAVNSLIEFVNENKSFPSALIEYVDDSNSDPVEAYRRELISAGYTGFNLEQLVYQFEVAIKNNTDDNI